MAFNWKAAWIAAFLFAAAGAVGGALIGRKLVEAHVFHDEIYGGYPLGIPVGIGGLVLGFLVGGFGFRQKSGG